MLSFEEFRENLCLHCPHCETILTNGHDTNFCFDLYKEAPAKFVSHVYYKLKKFKTWPISQREEQEMFREIFCKSGICRVHNNVQCQAMPDCMTDFIFQVTETSNIFPPMNKSFDTVPRGRTVKPKKPSISVLCGGSKEWIKKVYG